VLAKLSVALDRSVGRRLYRIHCLVYRRTGGLVGRRTPVGPILLLTTLGRRTGERRTTPLLYVPDGPRFVVVGSNGGRDRPPAWLLNLSARSQVEVQVGRRMQRAEAHVLTREERAAIWPRLVEHYRGWDYYRGLTEREIEVVSLAPGG
jgi:deazaflavin-dependent oxidoreductase (nitroreductase family)